MKNWLTPLLLVVSVLAFPGCTNTSAIIVTGLKLELAQVERTGDGAIQVTWRIKNPNIVPYLVDHTILKVTLDGVLVGTVTDGARLGVPPQSQAERTSVLTPADAGAAGRLTAGTASYRVDSTIFLLIYDDDILKASLVGSGNVPVIRK